EEDKLDDEEKNEKEVDAEDEDDETESDEDDIYKYRIRVRKDEDEEMLNAKVKDSDKGDEEVTDAAKADAEKTLEVKDDAKKTELPLTSSSLSVSSGFGDQFLKLSSNSYLCTSVCATVTTLPPLFVSTTPFVPQQTTTLIPTPIITTDSPTIITTVFESNALPVIQLRVAKLEKDGSKLKKIDLSVEALVALKTQVPSVVDNYLGSKVGDTPIVDLEQESEKTPSEILKIKKEQAEKQKMPKFTIKSTDKATLKEYDQKSALYQTMHANKSFNKNPANHRLYHALMEALIEDENSMDNGVDDIVQDHKRKHDDDEDDDVEEPPPLPGHLCHLTVVVDYFFNNDLEYLKYSYPERTYTTSITKTKAARYEIEGIEDMVPTLWSPTKVGYDKDTLKGIKHWGEGHKLWHKY
ncbi:hypothetical protein Tco_1537682, partial [Tanacetum coccineum]